VAKCHFFREVYLGYATVAADACTPSLALLLTVAEEEEEMVVGSGAGAPFNGDWIAPLRGSDKPQGNIVTNSSVREKKQIR
jgi:hypothetical protein